MDLDGKSGKIIKITDFQISDFVEIDESTSRDVVEEAAIAIFRDIFDFEQYNYFSIKEEFEDKFSCWWDCKYNGFTSGGGVMFYIEDGKVTNMAMMGWRMPRKRTIKYR